MMALFEWIRGEKVSKVIKDESRQTTALESQPEKTSNFSPKSLFNLNVSK